MGSLSSLYVSQSYQSLLHLGSDSSFFPPSSTPPEGFVEVQDGLGYPAGFAISSSGDIYFSHSVTVAEDLIVSGNFDIEGKITINDNVRVNGNLEVNGLTTLTGSLVVTNDITSSNQWIQGDLVVSGTIHAYEIITTIESASVIFSSGSNILGDDISDIQTLIGAVIISGSQSLTGSASISNNLFVLGEISSSTIAGIGNVFNFSQSVDSRLDFLEGPFSTSVDSRLDELETWSSSLQTNFVTETQLTQTASFLQNQINQKLNTSSFNAYTQSNDSRINTLSSFTASYATTGSNTFNGNQTINGTLLVSSSMIYSGSVRGRVIPITISSNTASIDCSLGNFFTVTLVSGSATRLVASNIQPGETIGLRITQPTASFGTVTNDSSIRFPQSFPYIATPSASAVDILSFQSYDTSVLYAVAVNTMR